MNANLEPENDASAPRFELDMCRAEIARLRRERDEMRQQLTNQTSESE